jgi:hypothetical protein
MTPSRETPTLSLLLSFLLACAEDSGPWTQGEDAIPVEGTCPGTTETPSDPFADCVEEFAPAEGVSFGHDRLPDVVLGPPHGPPGTEVASLGCGGRITLYFEAPGIIDGPGPDFIVFENPFFHGDITFAEPARVLVSEDGEHWAAFECDVDGGEASWPPSGCAGVMPVLVGPDDDFATDPARAGGDAFDLAAVGLSRAHWVRLVDRTEAYYGDRMWCEGAAGGFDLDAIAAVHAEAPR